MAVVPTDPTQPTPEATTDPAKKLTPTTGALPLAGAPATPAAPASPGATTQPAGPTAPVTPSGPATTSDPMAFAPTTGALPLAPTGAADTTRTAPGAATLDPMPANAPQAAPAPLQLLTGSDVRQGAPTGPGGFATSYAYQRDFPGVDFNTLPLGTTLQQLLQSGRITKQQIATAYGNGDPNQITDDSPLLQTTIGVTTANDTAGYNSYLAQHAGDSNNSSGHTGADGKYVPGPLDNLGPNQTPEQIAAAYQNFGSGTTFSGGQYHDPSGKIVGADGKPLPGSATTPAGGTSTPAAGGALNGLPAGPSTSSGTGSVSLTPTDPNHALTSQTIGVGPTADRFKLAQDEFDQFAKASDPAYQATLRSQDAHDFGAGRGVSGMHRNSIGDIATQRTNAMDTQRKTFLDQALNGSIDDAYKNVGIAERQQTFQSDQQKTAFQQADELQRLADSESAQSFAQAVQQAGLGFLNSPADFLKWIAGMMARSGAGA